MKRSSIVMILYIMVFLLAVYMKVLYKKPAENPITEYSVRPGTPRDLNLGSIFANDTTQAKINYSLYTQVLAPEPLVLQDSKDDWMISVTKHDLENYFFKVKGDADRINLESLNIIDVDSKLHHMLHVFTGLDSARFDAPYSIKSKGTVFNLVTDNFTIQNPVLEDSIYTIRLYKLNGNPRSWAYKESVTLELPENIADPLNNMAQSSVIINQSSSFVVSTPVYYENYLNKAILRFDNVSNEKIPENIALRIISVDRRNDEFFVNSPRISSAFFGLPISSYISVSGAAVDKYEIYQQNDNDWRRLPNSQIVKRGDYAIEINHRVRDIKKGVNRFRAIIDGVGGDKGEALWAFEAISTGFAIEPLIIPVSMTDIEKELFDNYMSSNAGASTSLPIVYESRDIHVFPQLSGIDRSMTILYGVQFVGLNGALIKSETWSGNENKGRETKTVPIDTDRIVVTASYEGQEIDRQSFLVAQYALENGINSDGNDGDNWVINILNSPSPRSGNRYDFQISIKDRFGKTIRNEDLNFRITTPGVNGVVYNLNEISDLYLVEFQAVNLNAVELIFEIIDPYSSINKERRTIPRSILLN